MSWQSLIAQYRQKWRQLDRWKDPDVYDCLAFLTSEAGELTKAAAELLIRGDGYTRNNPDAIHDLDAVFEEVAGVVLMASVLADLTGDSLDGRVLAYLAGMDNKRTK